MDIIQRLSAAGFALFPLVGKAPKEKGVDWTITPIRQDITRRDLPDNYGIVAGNRLIIDVDCKKGAPGKESFAKLTADIGEAKGWESKTFVVRSGTGGFHIYLNVPKLSKIRKHHKEYPGIDFLYGSCYAVGPESIHPDTHLPYQVVFGAPEAILDAPKGLIETLSKQPEIEVLGEKPQEGFVDDDPINIDRFKTILADMPTANPGNRGYSAYIAACRGRDFGLSLAKCTQILKECYNGVKLIPAAPEEEVETSARNAYRYAHQPAGNLNVGAIFKTAEIGEQLDFGKVAYDMNAKGQPTKSLNNCVNYIITLPHIKDTFRLNCFTNRIEISSDAPWFKERGDMNANVCDDDITLLKFFLAKTVKVEFATQTVLEAIVVVAKKRHYHPIRNYLKNLKWDGVGRIDTWLSDYGHALDTTYTRAVARKILCAAVRRVFRPGCKWDYVMIIEGAQGIGKSTVCRILGRNWGGDMNLDPHNKDSIHMMAGKWVIELSEMTALRWSDANALKSFITRETDTVRLSYERHAKDIPRQSIFIGTVNPEHVGYLNDITGNRRYWIIRFNGPVDLIGLEDATEQLWAEAMTIYEHECPYLTGEAEKLQGLETQARMPEDPMRSNVMKYVRENPDVVECTTDLVLEYIGVPMKSINRADQSRVAQALCEIGWEKELCRENGMFITRYKRPFKECVSNLMGEI